MALLERRVLRGDGKEKVAGSGVSVVLAQVFGGLGFGAATESKLEFINTHECHTTGLLQYERNQIMYAQPSAKSLAQKVLHKR